MKANVLTPKVKAERSREYLYQECYKDIGTQCLAMCLYTLDKRYGWKKQRLTEFTEAVKDTSKMLDTLTFNGRADAIDCRKYVKDRYGIDLDELPWELEIEK